MNDSVDASRRVPEKFSQSLPVPEYKMGWIIGKRGSYINQLSKKSGASISVSDSTSKEYGTVWKYVQITGSGRAVDRAKKLLHIRLERLEPRSDDSKGQFNQSRENDDDDGELDYVGEMNSLESVQLIDFVTGNDREGNDTAATTPSEVLHSMPVHILPTG